ncbi:MAG TPA: hypothetical protein VGM47_01290 [Gammaproteobacteria bacterium]|jgi:hypothetical protein
MRTLTALLATLFLSTAWADGPAPTAPSPAPAAASTAKLGKVEVTGMKPLVETLREVKVAVKRPFDNNPAHFDDMVCRLETGADTDSRAGAVLECGTQGWYGMRRNEYLFGNFGHGAVAVSTLGHPWHVVRALNMKQVTALRTLLKEVPAPGEGDVQVIDDQAATPAR